MSYQTSAATSAMPQPGDILLGRYVIEGNITRGGFSTIYRGRQLGVDRTVAIKCLDPDSIRLDPAAPQRFAREARMASGLLHPNTITIFDYGRTERGILFLVMEHVEGVSLNRILRYGRIDPGRAVHLVSQILHSLREAHGREIIHRDLKPANVMVCDRAGEQDVVKVLDFGIAKALGEGPDSRNLTAEITGSDRVIGTPRYMAPEQLNGGQVSPATDLYSVGLILFEMLVGRPAIDKASSLENMSAQLSDDPIPVPDDGTIPPKLIPVLRKACEKKPSLRYQSAKEFLDALEGKVEGQIIVGRVDEDDGNTRPMEADEIAAAKAFSRSHASIPDGVVNIDTSGAYPPVGYGGSMFYGRPRLLLMFNVLLAVLLVAVGVTLGVVLVTQVGGQAPRAPQTQAAAPVPAPPVAEATPAPLPTPQAMPAIEETDVDRATRSANARLGIQNARREVAWAAIAAENVAQPLQYVFTGQPEGAEVYLGPDRLGVSGETLTIDRDRLPAQVEIRHPDYLSMYTHLSADRTGMIHYALQPDPERVPVPEATSAPPPSLAAPTPVAPSAPTGAEPAPEEAEASALPPPATLRLDGVDEERTPSGESASRSERSRARDEQRDEEREHRPRRSSRHSRRESAEADAEQNDTEPRILLIDEAAGLDEPAPPRREEPAEEEPAEEEPAEEEPAPPARSSTIVAPL